MNLKHLNISHNPLFGPKGTKALVDLAFDEKSEFQIETLQIENCNIGDQGLSYLSATLEENDHLKFLNISKNGIGKDKELFL